MSLFAENDPRIEASLARLDALFDDSFAWWGEVYDPRTGGCFYALSAKENRDDPRFGPDIEATSKLVAVLEWSDLLEDASPSFKQGAIEYMQQRQDPETGFFRDPQHIDQYSANTLDRATGMASNVLRKCGGEPLYPMPMERKQDNAEVAEHFAHYESPEAFRAWLDDLPWDSRVWTAGARTLSQTGNLKDLPQEQYEALLAVADEYLRSQQGEDGMFGTPDDGWYSRLSGSYKTVNFFNRNGMEVPKVDQLAATTLDWLYSQHYNNSIVLYNTANMLNILQRNGANLSLEQRIAAVDQCIKILETMKGPDGGFVTHTDHPTPVEIGKEMGLNVVESNTNATGLVHKTRMLLIEFLTGQPGPHPHPAGEALLVELKRP